MEITANINERIETINARLDKIENELPSAPKAMLRLNRAASERVMDGTGRATNVVVESFDDLTEAAASTYKSLVDSAQHFTEDFGDDLEARIREALEAVQRFAEESVDYATKSVKQVAGQFGIAIGEADAEVARQVTKVAEKVEASEMRAERASLTKKTKAELYEMAKDLDIEGRATMSKGELVKALAAKR